MFAKLLLALILIAPATGSGPASSPVTETAARGTPAGAAEQPALKRSATKNRFIKWLQRFTPTGGGGTTEEGAYITFMQGDCQGTLGLARTKGEEELSPLEEPLRSVYEGAAAACLAAFHGRADLWRTARVDAGRVKARDLGCWDRSVFAILETLVDAYRADPQVRFLHAGGHTVGCPELGRTVPDHGPAEGGYRIRIHGRNLPPTLRLSWNSGQTVITATRVGPDVVELTVPPARGDNPRPDQGAVTIKIDDAYRIEPVYTVFRYDPKPGSGPGGLASGDADHD